jgi:glutamate synthase domain-containing protein 1
MSMKSSCLTERPPGDRNPSACGITALFNMDKKEISGKKITDMICLMRERENGQGAGFAVYGLFPKYRDQYCIQVLLDHPEGWEQPKAGVEELLHQHTDIIEEQRVYVKKGVFKEYPMVWRFFVDPKKGTEDGDELIKDIMMHINARIDGAFCMSGGKDMAVFKGSGWAEDIADFYKVRDIKGYMWSFHSRFPTNTPGWWGGAHPFSMVGHAVVHNGEITSYGTNVEYLKELGYQCRLMTDTEPLIYIFDYIVRKTRYPPEIAFQIATMAMAPPYWREIDRMPEPLKKWATYIRMVHRWGMANGPFSIVLTTDNPQPTMIGHTDRKKLRPLIAAVSEDESTFYLSSELNSIHEVDDTRDFWQPDPGKSVIATTDGVLNRGTDRDLEEFSKLLR